MSKYWRDVIERAARSFIQAALAVASADIIGVTTIDGAKGLLIASVTAGLSAAMSLVGRHVGDPDSGSWES